MQTSQEQLDQNIKENWMAGVGVRKPYTVFVCIMAILILGFFAFSKMSVDLFPSMNLPYAVVVLSPNQGELIKNISNAYQETIAETESAAAAKYSDATVRENAKNQFLGVLAANQDDQTKLFIGLHAIKGSTENPDGNWYATYFLQGIEPKLEKIMPTAGDMENLTNAATQAISSVSGIKNTQSQTMMSMYMVVMTLEYDSKATVDVAELSNAINNLGLNFVGENGVVYSNTILKIDPTLLPIMFVTVSHETKAGDEDWFKTNVLDKISSTSGVGSYSSNIEKTVGDSTQAWQKSGNGLVETYSIQIQKSSSAVTAEVCANVIRTLDKIKADNPGFTYDITTDQGEYINQTVGAVGENLVVGGVLALIILFLFLRSFKMTLAIGISIPLALVGTFVAMYFMGINLNIISMSGLALAVGMLVDNSVVVLENIFRLRSKGFPLKEACIKGASQIMMAMLASSLTTICVFFPMFFLDGLIMQVFTDLVWVVILSLMCSFVVAVMFLPSIVATFKINPRAEKVISADQKPNLWQKMGAGWNKFVAGTNNVFDKVLRFAINKKWLTVALAFVLFVGSGVLMVMHGFILLPSTDEGSLTVSATLNAAGQDETVDKETLAQPLYNKVIEVLGDDVEKCVVQYGSVGNSFLSSEKGMSVEIKLKDKRSLTTDQASEKLYNAFKSFDRTYYSDIDVTTSSMASSLVSSNVSVVMTIDANDYSTALTKLGEFSKKLDAKFADEKDELNIRSIVYDDYTQGIQQIVKRNGKYSTTITIKANPSANTNKIQSTLDQYVDELLNGEFKDSNISILDNGMAGEMEESYKSMGMALLVGFLLIYLVMVAIFQSFLMPFIILICVPLGFTGAFLLLAMSGMPLSIPALIGLLILMGVVINNGILAVDYTNQARRDGLSVKEALVSAMHTRMRPIFMTALTTVLAMVPMAFGWSFFNQGGSSEMMKPLAIVSIGGLLFGTVTTLIVVPAFYAIFCRDKKVKPATVTSDSVVVAEVKPVENTTPVITENPVVQPVAKKTVKKTATKSTRKSTQSVK